jgi:hypothetical protein
MNSPVFSAPFIEDTFSPMCSLHLCPEYILVAVVDWTYLCIFYTIPLVYISVFVPGHSALFVVIVYLLVCLF